MLTTENLKKEFKNPFRLVNYAIDLAKDMIRSDRPCRVHTPIQNRAYQILLEIAEKKDYFEQDEPPQEEDVA